MIRVEEWAEIRRLHLAEGRSIRAIARELQVARNTVRAAIRSGEPPRYMRARRGSIVDAAEEAIRRELQACPTMPTTVVAERIGWTRQHNGEATGPSESSLARMGAARVAAQGEWQSTPESWLRPSISVVKF